jgi:predicted RNase H-like HicB family nuclease
MGPGLRRGERKIVNPAEYPVLVEPLSQEDGGGFLATVPDLPGCMCDGETPEEAITNARDVVLCWMEAAEEMGRPAPPRSRRVAAG